MFGYGSLINSVSSSRTVPSADKAFPLKIHGFQRGWWARIPVSGLSTTYLGCIRNILGDTKEITSVNGVVFEVNKNDLLELDKREKGYTRVEVPKDRIADYCKEVDSSDTVWVYLNNVAKAKDFMKNNLPNENFPIVQSYIDVCVNGCLELESTFPLIKKERFTEQFISDTIGWNQFWVNDRIYPRRPFIHCPNAYQIDQLLMDNLADRKLFNKIYFE